jgi:integrative and conjugative element protein (TIGR02256 family)
MDAVSAVCDFEWYLPDGKRKVLIRGSALAHFWAQRQTSLSANESGGQLFGRLIAENIEISHVTGPYCEDARKRFSFRPSRAKQKTDILCQFRRGLHFVGDWHTHPVKSPSPSTLDISSMRECFRRSRHELDAFLMVIVGQSVNPAQLWVSAHSASSYWRLQPVVLMESSSEKRI